MQNFMEMQHVLTLLVLKKNEMSILEECIYTISIRKRNPAAKGRENKKMTEPMDIFGKIIFKLINTLLLSLGYCVKGDNV